jgi:hypothetical protein
MYHIASIVTPDYVDHALTMFGSITDHVKAELHLLVVTDNYELMDNPVIHNVRFYRIDDILKGSYGRINRLICHKYKPSNQHRLPELIAPYDYLRWSLKPGFVTYLLEHVADCVVFCDNDLFFYNDPTAIFDTCLQNDMTISPHWRTIYHGHSDEMKYNFMHGLYNGGYFTARKSAINILEWWSENCCIECSATSSYTYVDQKYLDLLPLYFGDQIGILKHKGCNVASWNRSYLERSIDERGHVTVAGQPIIFVHYSPITIKHIESGVDYALIEHLSTYNNRLTDTRLQLIREGKVQFVSRDVLNDMM